MAAKARGQKATGPLIVVCTYINNYNCINAVTASWAIMIIYDLRIIIYHI